MSLRLKAFWLHLLVSALLLSSFAGLVLSVWYAPWPLLNLQGGTKVLGMMVAVDVILGPSLTLLVFKPEKNPRMLVFDMTVVFALQLAAFGYGAWTLQSERPLFLAFAEDRIEIIRAPDADLTKLPNTIKAPGFFQPAELINVNIPNSQKMDALLYRLNNDAGYAMHTDYYQTFPGASTPEQFNKNALPFNDVMKNPETADKINGFLTKNTLNKEQVLLFVINGRNDQAIAVFAKDGMKFLGLVDAKI
ncbi:hypothetical protein JCM14076_19310 [Methylosoma difficile]